jgi:Concanavalin A-like lectin/glucanases superfamily
VVSAQAAVAATPSGGLPPRAYVVATYDGSTLRLYVNGQQAATTAVTGAADVNRFPIEIGSWVGGSIWNGTIDEVAVYRQPLTESEVARRYKIGLGQAGSSASAYRKAVESSAGLVSYWRLDDTGARALDRRGVSSGTYRAGVSKGAHGLISDDPDTAADFNGSKGSVIVPARPPLDVTKRFSLEAWVTTIGVGNRHIVGRYGSFLLKTDPSGHWTAGIYVNGQLHLATSSVVAAGRAAAKPATPAPAITTPKAHTGNSAGLLITITVILGVGSAVWIMGRPWYLRRVAAQRSDDESNAA